MAIPIVIFQKLNKKKANFCRISRNTGLLQGKVLSPVHFNMYLNDLASHFITENCPSLELTGLNLFVLKFADDTVIFANSPHELQIMLNAPHKYVSSYVNIAAIM